MDADFEQVPIRYLSTEIRVIVNPAVCRNRITAIADVLQPEDH